MDQALHLHKVLSICTTISLKRTSQQWPHYQDSNSTLTRSLHLSCRDPQPTPQWPTATMQLSRMRRWTAVALTCSHSASSNLGIAALCRCERSCHSHSLLHSRTLQHCITTLSTSKWSVTTPSVTCRPMSIELLSLCISLINVNMHGATVQPLDASL